MSVTARAGDKRTYGPELTPLLLLLGAGLWLWLLGLAAGEMARPANAVVHNYQWQDEPDRPAGIYRFPAPAAATALEEDWGRDGPAYLAIFTFSPIAINRADARTLTFLPGIGPVLSGRIVEHRTSRGPFQDSEELLEVHGIGPKTLSDILPRISVD